VVNHSAIARVGELIKILGWSVEQAQGFLKQHYGVSGRKQLSLKQLNQLIEQLVQLAAATGDRYPAPPAP
jgi:hypothetical protein